MNTLKFKTNIKCSGCIATVTPVLDKLAGATNWSVDLQSPDRILTVTLPAQIQTAELVKSLETVGYKAEVVS